MRMMSLLLLVMTGCATIVHGRYQKVPVTSDPAGAAVSVDCGKVTGPAGVTPTVVRLPRKAEACRLTVRKEGFRERSVTFTRHLSATTLWNLGLGFVVGMEAGEAAANDSFLCDNPNGCNDNSNSAAVTWWAATTGLGVLVDHATGALYRQDPARVDLKLDRSR